jgi:hypothetical protein
MMKNMTNLYEIILECPLNDPLNSCIFSRYRRMPVPELIDVSHQLDSEGLKTLLDRHHTCLNKRKTQKIAS